ncbi:MAG: histidine--tRNA ligase, partial [Candidatus Poribacteria bacterium]
MSIAKVRGTRDLLPVDMVAQQRVEAAAHEVFARFGYGEIRTPMFERTELFVRGIGEGTDIVSKETYTFEDRGGRSITLRPEGTAGVVRACLEQNLFKQSPVQKLYYVGPMFRYERPQAGRYREFWQAGIEAFGVSDPMIDAEVLVCAYEFVTALGIKPVEIRLNSIGNEERPAYIEKLKDYMRPHLEEMGGRDQERFEANPLRMFDSKDPRTRELLADGPKVADNLSPASVEHFEAVRRLLDKAGVPYRVDPYIVRGLDYYTRTVFELQPDVEGAQSTLCAGGRYDGPPGQAEQAREHWRSIPANTGGKGRQRRHASPQHDNGIRTIIFYGPKCRHGGVGGHGIDRVKTVSIGLQLHDFMDREAARGPVFGALGGQTFRIGRQQRNG